MKNSLLIATTLLVGCSGGWVPWSKSSNTASTGPYTPPGASAYACEGNKRLLVRFEGGNKSAWVIYPDREFRLDRVASGPGDRFSNGRTTLTVKDGEAALEESGKVEFGKCKAEAR